MNYQFFLVSAPTWCVPVSAFASLVHGPTDFASSTIGFNFCGIIAAIKKKTQEREKSVAK